MSLANKYPCILVSFQIIVILLLFCQVECLQRWPVLYPDKCNRVPWTEHYSQSSGRCIYMYSCVWAPVRKGVGWGEVWEGEDIKQHSTMDASHHTQCIFVQFFGHIISFLFCCISHCWACTSKPLPRYLAGNISMVCMYSTLLFCSPDYCYTNACITSPGI